MIDKSNIFGIQGFNGGKSQANLAVLNGGGEYPFINKLKEASRWGWKDGTSVDPLTPDLFDTDGYPVSSTLFTTHGGVTALFFIPSQIEYPGDYKITWTGNGTVFVGINGGGGTLTTSGGSLTSTTGSGSYQFTLTTATALSFGITAIGNPRITNVQIYNVNDEIALLKGQIWSPQFLLRLRQANFGILRFLNWRNDNFVHFGNWDTSNRPVSYFQYALSAFRSDLLCNSAGSGLTTNSGSDYTVSAPSNWSGLTDKALVHLTWNATCPTTTSVTINSGVSNITWTSHGLANNNSVILTLGAGATLPSSFNAGSLTACPMVTNTIYFVNVVDSNTITLSATKGGSAIIPNASSTGTITARAMPTININGTGALYIYSAWLPLTVSGNSYLTGGSVNSLDTLNYDAAINAWNRAGAVNSPGGLQNGVPYSLCLNLCATVGSHPWFIIPYANCTPMSDLTTQLATLCKTTGPSWMVPRFEGPNEEWNNTFPANGYANAVATTYTWGQDSNNWQGRACSTIGQAVNAVYGGSVDGSKYRVIIGFQTSSLATVNSTNNISRIASTKYQSQTPQVGYLADPAHKWCTSVCCSTYMNAWQLYYNQEAPLAFSYFQSPTNTTLNSYVNGLLGGGSCTVSGSTFTLNGHGFLVNQVAAVMAIYPNTLPTGISNGVNYYVVNPTTNTFQLSLSEGGSAITTSGATSGFYVVLGAGQNDPNIPTLQAIFTGFASWAASFGGKIIEVSPYEGGYSPGYGPGVGLPNLVSTSTVTAATNANPMVLTITNATMGAHTAQSTANNPVCVVGMYIQLSGMTGSYTVLNGTFQQVTAVSGTSVTVSFDASGFGAAFSGTASTVYYADNGTTSMQTAILSLRVNSKLATNMTSLLTQAYNTLTSSGNGTVVVNAPSLFQTCGPTSGTFGGASFTSNNGWSVLEDIYAVDPPQWTALRAYNN